LHKPYGINLRCYWEGLEETTWELGEPYGNTLGTRKKTKNPPSYLPQRKKLDPHECMLSLLIGHMKLLFPKLVVTIFGLG
jgi:hypothetical protein